MEMAGSVAMLLNILAMVVFYGAMLAVVVLIRKVSKDIADIKRAIVDLQETLALIAPEVRRKAQGVSSGA